MKQRTSYERIGCKCKYKLPNHSTFIATLNKGIGWDVDQRTAVWLLGQAIELKDYDESLQENSTPNPIRSMQPRESMCSTDEASDRINPGKPRRLHVLELLSGSTKCPHCQRIVSEKNQSTAATNLHIRRNDSTTNSTALIIHIDDWNDCVITRVSIKLNWIWIESRAIALI